MEFNNIDKEISKNQGNIGVSRAIYEYTRMGYTVLLPFSDSDKYDLVIDNKIELLKVQVKTSRCKAIRRISSQLKNKRRKYEN
jgi:hypothetical protein